MEIVVILHRECLRGAWTVDFWVTVRQKFIITTSGLCYVWAWVVINHSFGISKSGMANTWATNEQQWR
jgi:hypothetical protein